MKSISFINYIIADAGTEQAINCQYSFMFASIAFVVTIAILNDYRRTANSPRIACLAVALMVLHPIFTVSPTRGDLGINQRLYSMIFTSVIVALMFVLFFRQRTRGYTGSQELPSFGTKESRDNNAMNPSRISRRF